MNKIIRFVAVALAYLVVTASAFGQQGGTTTNHSFAIGKGIGQQGYTSLLCAAGKIPVGQAGADPICQTITGDITISAAGVAALVNIPTGTPMVGTLLSTAIAAPSTPASGKASVWVDSTDKRWHDKNDAGTVATTTVPSTCSASNWVRTLSSAGILGCLQPGISDLAGLAAGIGTWLGTPTSANLAAALTDETGTGAAVFGTAPTLGGLVNFSGARRDATQSTPAQITSDQNDYNPSSVVCATSSTLIINSDIARNITGIAGGVAGCDLFLVNNGSFTITLKDGSVSSSAANRFAFGADFQLGSKAAAHLKYDGSGSFWRNTTGSGTGGGGGTVTQVNCGNQTITTSGTCQTDSGLGIQNCGIAASVASNILTVSMTDASGATPSSTSPCRINFRSSTANAGTVTSNYQTAALSINTNAVGASLGSPSNAALRFWVVVFDNAGADVMALINCSNATTVFPLNETAVATTVAMSAGATSAGVFYTPNGTTLTSKAFRILGYVEYNSTGLTTAGTYASAPNFIQIFGPGVKKPGDTIQVLSFGTTSNTTASTTTPVTTALTINITPTSAANPIRAFWSGGIQDSNTGTSDGVVQLFRGSTALAPLVLVDVTNVYVSAPAFDLPNSSTATTYAVKVRNDAGAGVIGFPGTLAGAFITVEEIMG